MNERKYGWKPDVPDFRDRVYCSAVSAANLPESVDLRAGMPPVWNQGTLGSCTAHAIAAAVQFCQKKKHPQWDFMPSRLFVYYNERVAEGTVNEDAGAMIRTGIKVLNAMGVCKESYWPYETQKFAMRPTPVAYKNALEHQSLSYRRVPQTLNGLKGCLASGVPVVFGIAVYESFESRQVAETGVVPMPNPNEKSLGGHAIIAVGYDERDRTFLVRNSWGADWGIQGHFKLPYDYILNENLADDFWAVSEME